jgi:NADH-quinone oxidoreductase subunit N
MLAFSTIAQMGFLLLAMLAGVVGGDMVNAQSAYGSAMFYVVTYVLTTLAVFGVIMLLARQGFESEEIADLAGLNQRSPLYAGVMALGMFSLAGVPPLVGFYAKLSVLDALISAQGTEYMALAIFAVLISLVGAFYYLRVVKVMYFDPVPDHVAVSIEAGRDVRVVLTLNAGLIVLVGLLPGGLMTLCAQSMASVLKSLGS